MEIFGALFSNLPGDAASVDVAIADFERRRRCLVPPPDLASVRACSSCAGDYEDPDRTAWTEVALEEEGDGDPQPAPGDELPAPHN